MKVMLANKKGGFVFPIEGYKTDLLPRVGECILFYNECENLLIYRVLRVDHEMNINKVTDEYEPGTVVITVKEIDNT